MPATCLSIGEVTHNDMQNVSEMFIIEKSHEVLLSKTVYICVMSTKEMRESATIQLKSEKVEQSCSDILK